MTAGHSELSGAPGRRHSALSRRQGARRRGPGAASRAVARRRAPLECAVRPAHGRDTVKTASRSASRFFPNRNRCSRRRAASWGSTVKSKMSKSMGNTIGLLESPEVDLGEAASGGDRSQANSAKPIRARPKYATSIICTKASARRATVEHVATQCSTAGWGCIDCKKVLAESMEQELVPIRTPRRRACGRHPAGRRRAGERGGSLPSAGARDDGCRSRSDGLLIALRSTASWGTRHEPCILSVVGLAAGLCCRALPARMKYERGSFPASMRFLSATHSRESEAWKANRRVRRTLDRCDLQFFTFTSASIHRDVTPQRRARVQPLRQLWCTMLNASATLCDECAQKRSHPGASVSDDAHDSIAGARSL